MKINEYHGLNFRVIQSVCWELGLQMFRVFRAVV